MPSFNCHGDFCALISALIQADAELLEVAIPFVSLTVSSSLVLSFTVSFQQLGGLQR
jgi:hypothetical protein